MLKKMRLRTKLLLIVAALMLSCFACIYAVWLGKYSEYADFSHYATSADLRTVLLQQLPPGTTNRSQVEQFLNTQKIAKCGFRETEIACYVLAPSSYLQNTGNAINDFIGELLVTYRYYIVFTIQDDHLTEIAVRESILAP